MDDDHSTQVRIARTSDLDILLAIEDACFLELKEITRRSFQRFVEKSRSILLVVEVQGQVCGYAIGIVRRNSQKIRLYSIAILPAYQGRGLAKLLMNALETLAVEQGKTSMHLEVREDNAAGIHFYKKLGYQTFDYYHNYYDDGCAAKRMNKALAAKVKPVSIAKREIQGVMIASAL